jgi:thermitase
MSLTQRISLLAAALAASLVILIIFQSATQEAKTQTERGGAAAEQPSFPTPSDGEYVPGEVIVGLEEDATQADLAALNRRTDASTEKNLPSSDVNLVDLPRGLSVQEAVQRYEASAAIEYAEPNFLIYATGKPTRTPNDPYFGRLWGLHNTGQSIAGRTGISDADVDAPEAWNTSTKHGQDRNDVGTVVAIIDEGVDTNHPDLKDNIWTNPDEVPRNGRDDDSNGYVDDVHGYDFFSDDASVYDPNPVDGSGEEHGTHVAGTIAAEGNNRIGVAGIDWQSRIMALKVLGPNGGSTLDAVEAINYAVRSGVKISNNSWGYVGSPSRSLQNAISRANAAGHLFVAAAGNGGADRVGDNNDANASNTNYPSSYDNANIIAVAATDNNDRRASFSNYGANTVDLAAPGVLKSQNPNLGDTGMKSRILNSVDKKSGLSGKVLTGGRLNAAKALS